MQLHSRRFMIASVVNNTVLLRCYGSKQQLLAFLQRCTTDAAPVLPVAIRGHSPPSQLSDLGDFEATLQNVGFSPPAAALLLQQLMRARGLPSQYTSAQMLAKFTELQQVFGSHAQRLVQRSPRALLLGRFPARQRMEELSALLGVTPIKATSMVLAVPELVVARHATLERKLDTLAALLGISREAAGAMVARSPRLLAASSKSLEEKLERYRTLLNCSREVVCQRICRQPRLLLASHDILDDRIQQLGSIFSAPVDTVMKAATACPLLLAWSTAMIKIKLDAYTKMLRTDLRAMQQAVLSNPRLLTLSLVSAALKVKFLEEQMESYAGWKSSWQSSSIRVRARAVTCSQLVLDRLAYVAALQRQHKHSWGYVLNLSAGSFHAMYPGFPAWHAKRAAAAGPGESTGMGTRQGLRQGSAGALAQGAPQPPQLCLPSGAPMQQPVLRHAPCIHCGVTEAPQWRREPGTGHVLCNACGIYLRTHGHPRPTELQRISAKGRAAASDALFSKGTAVAGTRRLVVQAAVPLDKRQ